MTRSALEALVCPDTLQPLRLVAREEVGTSVTVGDLLSDHGSYPIRDGIPSFVNPDLSDDQTVQSFVQKWAVHRYYREHTRAFYTAWYLQRYGFGTLERLRQVLGSFTHVLDAGTGSGRDAVTLADQSSATVYAVDTARDALVMAQQEIDRPQIAFVHADVRRLPFPDGFFDFVNCDQVIHHTPAPRDTFEHLKRKLKAGGQVCCYVYRKKAVLREFSDDFIRERIAHLPIDEALRACEGITRLGRTLAALKQDVQIEEDIPLLGIQKGTLDLQRFFHWNVMKCFWNDDFDFFTNNIINFDWYHPKHCFRFEPEEFRTWFADGWDILAWDVQEAGISCRARKV
jgi:SAM-dependent methyltransferase